MPEKQNWLILSVCPSSGMTSWCLSSDAVSSSVESKIRPIVPITLGVISVISIIGFITWPVICPISVIVITPAFFGMGCFLFFRGLWCTRWCSLRYISLWRLWQKWIVFLLCSSHHLFLFLSMKAFLWKNPFLSSFLSCPSYFFLCPCLFPQKAVSCWSSSHAAKPLPFDLGRKPGSWSFSSFLAITFWSTFLEGPAVDYGA